jgi:2'-5' RNA ligase
MFYSLVYYPQIDISKINEFRRKYDPYVDVIDAHITMVFPVPDKIGKDALTKHIDKKLSNWNPFEITINGLKKSWDHWLFLVLQEGEQEVVKLHDDLYTGILGPYVRSDIEFIPHIGIGLFVTGEYDVGDPHKTTFDQSGYNQALKEAEALDTGQQCLVDRLALVEIDDEFRRSRDIQQFHL